MEIASNFLGNKSNSENILKIDPFKGNKLSRRQYFRPFRSLKEDQDLVEFWKNQIIILYKEVYATPILIKSKIKESFMFDSVIPLGLDAIIEELLKSNILLLKSEYHPFKVEAIQKGNILTNSISFLYQSTIGLMFSKPKSFLPDNTEIVLESFLCEVSENILNKVIIGEKICKIIDLKERLKLCGININVIEVVINNLLRFKKIIQFDTKIDNKEESLIIDISKMASNEEIQKAQAKLVLEENIKSINKKIEIYEQKEKELLIDARKMINLKRKEMAKCILFQRKQYIKNLDYFMAIKLKLEDQVLNIGINETNSSIFEALKIIEESNKSSKIDVVEMENIIDEVNIHQAENENLNNLLMQNVNYNENDKELIEELNNLETNVQPCLNNKPLYNLNNIIVNENENEKNQAFYENQIKIPYENVQNLENQENNENENLMIPSS